VSNDQTLQDVADSLEVHLHTYHRWECGIQSIPTEILPRVAKAVNRTPMELLGVAA